MASDEQYEEGQDGLCPRCSMLGRSRTFNSRITGYRNSAPITVTRFRCEDPDCGAVVDEVSLAGQAARRGLRLTLAVPAGDAGAASRTRLLLKADTATISIPELEFEISPSASVPFTGDLTTVEGCLRAAANTLGADQEQRRADDAERAGKIDAFLQELLEYADGQHSFTLVVEDPSGNSFIGAPGSAEVFSREAEGGGTAAAAAAAAPAAGAGPEPRDPLLTEEPFRRSAAQSERLGLDPDAEPFVTVQGPPTAKLLAKFGEQRGSGSGGGVRRADGACASCGATVSGRVHVPVQPFIPDAELLEMACGACGLPSVEVRRAAGGRVPTGGQRLCLRVEAPEDLRRLVLASAGASLSVPELDLAFSGTEAGMFSSVGRLLSSVLGGLINTRGMLPEAEVEDGGGQVTAAQREWQAFAADAEAMLSLQRSWTLVLVDPRCGSFISPLQGGADDRLTVSELVQAEEGRGPAGSAA